MRGLGPRGPREGLWEGLSLGLAAESEGITPRLVRCARGGHEIRECGPRFRGLGPPLVVVHLDAALPKEPLVGPLPTPGDLAFAHAARLLASHLPTLQSLRSASA